MMLIANDSSAINRQSANLKGTDMLMLQTASRAINAMNDTASHTKKLPSFLNSLIPPRELSLAIRIPPIILLQFYFSNV